MPLHPAITNRIVCASVSIGLLYSTPVFAAVDEPTKDLINTAEKSTQALSVKKGNWVFAPMPVSNATLGTGLQVVALYLHPQHSNDVAPSATTGIVGMRTDTDTWAAGAFHQNALLNDRLRIIGGIGSGGFELKYFGITENSPFANQPIDYRAEMDVLYLEGQVRIPGTDNWFAGPAYGAAKGDIVFETNASAWLPEISANTTIASLSLLLSYDTSNDNYYPTSGNKLRITLQDFSENWGGDYEFKKYQFKYSHYFSLNKKLTLALDLDAQGSANNPPFFGLPSLDLRGYEFGQFADNYALLLRSEIKYKFHARWGAIGFIDKGWTNDKTENFFAGREASSSGIGIRWQVVAERTMNLGIDIAFTGDDEVFIIKVGETF